MPEEYQLLDSYQKRAFWENHIEQWQRSELNQSAYCRQHHLKAHRFFYWRKRILEPSSDVSFVPLALPVNRVNNHRAADVRAYTHRTVSPLRSEIVTDQVPSSNWSPWSLPYDAVP